jgi:hypothetical protein
VPAAARTISAAASLTVRVVGSTIRGMRSRDLGRGDDLREDEPSGVVPVGPVVPVRAPRGLPRVLVVALLVGTAAFVAGLQLGATRPADLRPVVVPSVPASPVVPSVPASPSAVAPSASVVPGPLAGPPYASAFADAFQPPDLFAQYVGGTGCVSHNEQTQEAIGVAEYVLKRTWTTFCPLEPASRPAVVKDLIVALSDQMPGSHLTETSDGADSTRAVFPYTQNRFIGTVTLSADATGSGFQIAISLQERRAP